MTETGLTEIEQQVIALKKKEIAGLNWDLLKKTYCATATNDEAIVFVDQCIANSLDPRKRDIYFVKYKDTKGQCIVGYQSYIARAERTGKLNGWKCTTLYNGKEMLVGAKCTIHRTDWEQPFEWEIEWKEFNRGRSTHDTMPAFMCKKVCIAQAFRMAFPTELGGMPYTKEEVDTFMPAPVEKNITSEVMTEPITKNKPASKVALKTPKKSITAPAEKVVKKEDNLPMDTTPEKEEPEDAEIIEPEVIKGDATKVEVLDSKKRDMILTVFDKFGIGKEDIEKHIDTEFDYWTESHRQHLLSCYHKLNNGSLTSDDFKATTL